MITNLKVTHLRNLTQVNLNPSQCNLIIGDNGSGKTSLLESLFLLARGKSFRTDQAKRYIQHHKQASIVFASFADQMSLAIKKQPDSSTLLKVNGNSVKTQSQVTQHMPTLLIDPSSMNILEQGSASRRQLLDWLAFHTQPDFYNQWLAYQRLLKQRNSLLRKISQLNQNNHNHNHNHNQMHHLQQLQTWDMGLSSHTHLIDYYRQTVFDSWLPFFKQQVISLLPQYADQLTISYQAGFDNSQEFHQLLEQRRNQDIEQGYTRVGCHRADVHVHWKSNDDQHKIKEQAVNYLSRGEKKLLITALKLSQLSLLQSQKNSLTVVEQNLTYPIVLLDDITAELDETAINSLLATLAEQSSQVFLTSLTDEVILLIKTYWKNYQIFDIKEGTITSRNHC